MNKEKFKKYLKKLKQYDKMTDLNEEPLSLLERDLLLDYIKKMYEAVLSDEKLHDKSKKHKIKHIKNNPQKEIQQENRPLESEVEVEPDNNQNKIKTENTDTKEETIRTEQKTKTIQYDFSPAFMEIFEDKEKHELSDKLSMMPIKDLKKAFSINDRIFTVHELFDNNESDFEEAVNVLNSLSGFNEAKEYILKNLAPKYNWDNEKKIKKAAVFIKIIKRRYL